MRKFSNTIVTKVNHFELAWVDHLAEGDFIQFLKPLGELEPIDDQGLLLFSACRVTAYLSVRRLIL